MNEHNMYKEETLRLIKEVKENPSANQRILSQKVNISLGKTNYLLKELVKKGFVKVASFSKKPEKAKKVKYFLTKRGANRMMELAFHFMKTKEREYKKMKEEYESYIENMQKPENENNTNGRTNAKQ